MLSNFDACCGFSLRQEGGFCDVKGDPGGATNHGITMAELSAVLGRPATVDDVRNLTAAQSEAIYKPRYWVAVSGDALPAGVDLVAFDFGLNAGPRTSAMQLQALIKVEQDGVIGPATLAALATHDRSWVIAALTLSHQAYYRRLPGYGEFGPGWIARTVRCQAAAGAMVPHGVAA
ncbi:MAG TPA: glycosyl hydrolase 108 family protein [Acidocella sp.]|jgi:lysozyme family protein|uniref:glycoside hydrolase family 108 protein n=1 Tax=Acidocella sp. TaxID=50710 RepID=UPI002C57887B|nr:glycosyl hydrolase 108 family protein [Acidocella sp.]HVE20672.1 glycosyl hydrolase 108 family protein [Acidocella sp.]